jgi:hypothetical protein
VVAEKITLAEAKGSGLSAKEAEMAQKHGVIEKDEPKPEEKKVVEAEKKEEVKPEEKPEEKKAADATDLPADYSKFTPNEKALYWERKKERTKRQRAEAEKELLQLRIKNLEKELAEKKPEPKAPAKDDLNLDDLLDDKSGKETELDPKDKPLTVADLEKREKDKAEAEKNAEAEKAVKAKELRARLSEFEIEAQEKFGDFNEVADLAKDILEKGVALFDGDEDMAELAQARAERALHGMVNAMKWEEGQKTPAEMVYDLGRLHPKYRNRAKGASETVVPPEKLERMIENAGKRSSASLPGGNGSRRVVSVDDLTPEEAAKLTPSQYMKLPKAARERLLRM